MIFAIICIYRCIYGYWVLSTGWFPRICGKVYFLSFLLIIFLVVSFISMNLFIVNSYIHIHTYMYLWVLHGFFCALLRWLLRRDVGKMFRLACLQYLQVFHLLICSWLVLIPMNLFLGWSYRIYGFIFVLSVYLFFWWWSMAVDLKMWGNGEI